MTGSNRRKLSSSLLQTDGLHRTILDENFLLLLISGAVVTDIPSCYESPNAQTNDRFRRRREPAGRTYEQRYGTRIEI